MAKGWVSLDVTKWPELIFGLRQEMAKRLREEADMESDPRVARKLKKVADEFEVGNKT